MICPVRTCREPLALGATAAVCPAGHTFDLARSGYLNLLQPQDRRSKTPGDSAEAVAARRRFLDGGFARPLTEAIAEMAAAGAPRLALDAGCGVGDDLEAIRHRTGCEAWGVDISVRAIDTAARRHPECHFVVANADRILPWADASFDVVTSVTARLNPGEYHRLLRAEGQLVVAIPAPDDLIELRSAILGEGEERDRVERTVALFAPSFALVRHERVRARPLLDQTSISDVMTTSYRALRTRERARLLELDPMEVTLSRDLLSFRPV
jgi:23S rRNA (guanine745-N1)-methyltransferase